MRSIICTVSSGYWPDAVSAESISASLPSSTAFATSEASARVGRGFCVMDSSICVAVITGRRASRALDDLLLHDRHAFGTHLHAEIAARDHHAVGHFENRVQIFDGLRLFEFGDDRRVASGAPYRAFGRSDIGCAPHETHRDVIHVMLQRKSEIVVIFFRERRHLQFHARQIDAFMLAENSRHRRLRRKRIAPCGQHPQFDQSIGEQDAVAAMDFARQHLNVVLTPARHRCARPFRS